MAMQRKQRVLATSNVLEVLLLMILALSTPSLSVASTTTVIEQVSTLDYSQAPNGSYFPSFKVEERQGWPREVWPRGEAWSRRVLTERAMSEIQKGAVVVLFASTPCQLCSLVVNIFDEMAVPVAVVTFASDASSQGGGSTHPPPDPLRAAALELAGSKREPYVFLGTRFLGDPMEVQGMLYTGELHGRVRAYGVLPRTQPPVNRAPVVTVQAEASSAEGERHSIGWQTSWAHPVVWLRVEVTVLEAKELVGFGFSYDPVQRKVVRGAAPTPGYPFGEESSNTLVEVRAESAINRSSAVFGSLAPVWNETLSLFPIRSTEAPLHVALYHVPRSADPLLAGDEPLLLGTAILPLPPPGRAVEGWYGVGGDEAGEAQMGVVRVRVQTIAEYHLELQQGAAVRVGGLLVTDPDALNSTLQVTLQADRGLLSIPANARIAFVRGDPITREHPGVAASRRFPRYSGLGEARGRIGFVEGDGEEERRMVFEGALLDIQAALRELEYDAPSEGAEDRISVTVNDKGHTGQGGNKTGHALVSLWLVEGRRNQAPHLHMWPEMRGRPSIPYSGAAVTRYVPLGVEAGLFGIQIRDDDAYEGEVEVTVRAELGRVSLQGRGPWDRSAASRHRFADAVKAARPLAVFGRELTSSERRGMFRRTVICSGPGGFASELLVQGPTDHTLSVSINDPPGSVIEGAASNIKDATIEAGDAIVLHHDAHDDFEVHYWVSASKAVNILVMEHASYVKYLTGRHFLFHPEASTLEQAEAMVSNVLVRVERSSRWYLVIEEARDAFKPGWRTRFRTPGGGAGRYRGEPGEIETGVQEEDVVLQYEVRMQRGRYTEEGLLAVTGARTILEPTATALCAWILLDQDGFAPPPGLDSLGVRFSEGDGHDDAVMRFTGRVERVQDALSTLSYLRVHGDSAGSGAALPDMVRISVDDQGHSGAGGPQRASLTVTVEVWSANATLPPFDDVFVSTPGTFWDGRVGEVREESCWLDVALQPFAGLNADGTARYGERVGVRSVRVAAGSYTGPGLADALTRQLARAYGHLFWSCAASELAGERADYGGECAGFEADPPMQLRDGSGGRIKVTADAASMTFNFEYDAAEVTNGRYKNAMVCEQGGGPAAVESNCGWWGGRFVLLFESGPNRERSLASLLGFQQLDYVSTGVQYAARVLAARGPPPPAALAQDNHSPAQLAAPYRYFVDLVHSRPANLRSGWGANRPPQITLRYKTRADIVSVSVPPGSMAGLCRVRTSGIDYAGPALDGGLEVEEGVGALVKRFWQLRAGDVTLRDYAYQAAYLPDPERAQMTFEWDYAVLVSEIELIMTSMGVVVVEGFVGGVVDVETGQYRAEDSGDGWVSVGSVTGSAGAGPFAEGTRSSFHWPNNTLPGQLFRVRVHQTWAAKHWALYRAFPRWQHRTLAVHGLPIIPRLALAVAGEETPLTGVGVEDLDLGDDTVQAADLEVRRLTATLECRRGLLFVDVPYSEAAGVGGRSGYAARAAGQARGDAETLAVQGDKQLGVGATDPIPLAQGNTAVFGKAWARPKVPGVDVLELATWRGAGGGRVTLIEGNGVGDRRVVMEGRLAAIQQALRGLRYKGVERADPGRGGGDGERVCTAGRMCAQTSASLASRYAAYGARGYDAISITVSDNGHSERVCSDGGKDPLAPCQIRPGAEQIAHAVLEVTIVPKSSNQLGSRATSYATAEQAAFNGPPSCMECYVGHPADSDLCVHVELYWGAPDKPGHSYRLSALKHYSAPQRRAWEEHARRPCALSSPPPSRPDAPPPAPRSAHRARVEPSLESAGEAMARLLEAAMLEDQRPWE